MDGMKDFLGLAGKRVLVTGVANQKSVAAHVARILLDAGAHVALSVRDEAARLRAEELFPGLPTHLCDVERDGDIRRLAQEVSAGGAPLQGFLHCLAFANYAGGLKPFHETLRADFMQAMDIGMFSLVALSRALAPALDPDASVVALSISTTSTAAASYGYMAPVKAALDSAIPFMAKSFSAFSRVRFNAVCAGPLKTSASAGIPGYLDNYLYAEMATFRHRALETPEVARLAAFLLSPASSGMNGGCHKVDAGMGSNFFDEAIVRKATRDA